MGATYWIGQDGNIYYGSGQEGAPVQNLGNAEGQDGGQYIAKDDGLYDRYTDNGVPTLTFAASRIDDPALNKQTSSTGGGSTAPANVLNTAAIDNTKKTIASYDNDLNVGYSNIDDDFNSLISKYDKEKGRNRADFDSETVSNNQSLLKNKQNGLLAAAQGRRGLRGTLSALGALSGDGEVLADRAVTTAANQDIGEAVDTYGVNAQNLDKSWKNFEDEDKDRRAEAQTSKANQRTALERDVLTDKQSAYQKLAELFAEGGNTGEATNWLNQAGDLSGQISSKGRVSATPFSARSAAFTPGDLESYLAGAGDLTVDVRNGGSNGTGGPSTVLAGRGGQRDKRREREEALV